MSSFLTSKRVADIQDPVIPIVGNLIRQNPGTISLGQGVVYYNPPEGVQAQVQSFFENPLLNQYGSVNGINPLRELIAGKLDQEDQIQLSPNRRVMVTAGGNMAFSHAILAICDPGDEVILPSPFYFNHEMAIRLADCVPLPVPTDRQYQLDLYSIRKAIGPRTRAIVTVSPNNPTGVIYPKKDLMALNTLCKEKGIFHIHDAAYEYFSYDKEVPSNPASFAGSEPHTFSLHSLSKSYGFASWRIGYMVYPGQLYESMQKIQDTQLICPTVLAQFGAMGAMEAGKKYALKHLPSIQAARTIFLENLAHISDICEVPEAKGAFYFLLKLDTDMTAMEVVEKLILEHKVAVIPGDTFGITRGCYLRIAYGALQETQAKVGIQRLIKGLRQILG